MNAKFAVALALAVAVLLIGCSGAVPVTADPTVVPTDDLPTAVPSPTPTLEPTATPTEVPTVVPSPTATPFVLPALDEWAAANGFQHMGDDNAWLDSIHSDGTAGPRSRAKYYEKRVGNGIAFWIEDREYEFEEYPPMREVAVRMPDNAPKAAREEALNVWARNLSELFMPAVAEWVAGVTLVPAPDGDPTNIWIDGYIFSYGTWDMGRGDTAFYVYGSPNNSPPPTDDPGLDDGSYYTLAKSIEPVASQDCLAVIPADLDFGEEFDSWVNQYLDNLSLEVLGEEQFPMGSEVFLLPLDTPDTPRPNCVVVLYRDVVSGESFLIYETADGIVKVPFEIPPGQ